MNGWTMTGNSKGMSITNQVGNVINFDIVVKTRQGAVFAARFVRDAEINAASTAEGISMNINKAHALLGHCNEDTTRQVARGLGWTITRGSLKPCAHCAIAKAKQKNTVKVSVSEDKAKKPGERLFLDITTISVPRADGTLFRINRKYFRGAVDQATGKKWGGYSTSKNGMVEPMCEFLHQMKANGVPILCIRCDPAGENHKLEKRCKSADWAASLQPIKFEFTSRDTPQHNSLVELMFPNIVNKAKAAMLACFVPLEMKANICIEAIKHVIALDGLHIVELNGEKKTRDQHVFGQNPKWVTHMRTFGEAGVVAEGKHGKIGDRGIPMMFVGYSDRESDSVRMWNPDTNGIVTSRDVVWLNRYFFKQPDTPFQVDENFGFQDGAQQSLPVKSEEEDTDSDDGVEAEDEADEVEEAQGAEDTENERHVRWADALEEHADRAEPVAGENDVPVVRAPILTRSGRISRAPERLIEVMEPSVDGGQISAAELRYLSLMQELDNEEISMQHQVMREYAGCNIENEIVLPSVDINDAFLQTEIESDDEVPELLKPGDYDYPDSSDDEGDNDDLDFETAFVGAGVGGGYSHTNELKVLNYKQAMASSNRQAWLEEIDNEYKRFEKFKVFKIVPRSELNDDDEVKSTTWAFKQKSNGKCRGRLNARGFEQVEGKHYNADFISSPVTNPMTIRFCLALMCCNPKWIAEALDVEGAFLQGKFRDGEKIYIEVPDGMEKYYGNRKDVALLLLVPIYGTKQAANCFYDTLVKSLESKTPYRRSTADPCLFYAWIENHLVLFTTWIDDVMILGEPQDVKRVKREISALFVCKDEGALVEYVGAKLNFSRDADGIGTMKVTQPVLVDKLRDMFGEPTRPVTTPAVPGQELVRSDSSELITKPAEITKYRAGTALCMYKTQWSRPDVQNATRACARMMQKPQQIHMPALVRLAHYIVSTPERGLVLHPNRKWDGSKHFKFRIGARSDSNYASNTDDRRSVTGVRASLEGCPITFRSNTQKYVTLSVTEAESGAGVTALQDMMYLSHLTESVGLEVEKPMILEMDNKGAVDMANNWSAGGRTRHMDVRMHYMRELKDRGLIVIRHISGDDNDTDIFTKNTATATFLKHIPVYVGTDQYMVPVVDLAVDGSSSDNA
jgi:hypothetical protein